MADVDPFLELHLVFLQRRVERRRLRIMQQRVRDMSDPFTMPEISFRRLFRLSKEMCRDICDLLRQRLQRRLATAIPVHIQVLAALRFFAEGGYQRGVGQDFLIAMSQPAMSKCIKDVCAGLLALANEWIVFPNTVAQRQQVQHKFQEVFVVPGVIGAIDCTHISIVTPNEHEEAYNNPHHGHHSLNVQMICDRDLRVRNLNARYPGRTNDHFIWRNSAAREELERLHRERIGNFYVIGDSGYAAEPWLLTPVLRAEEGSPEERYTSAHCSARNCIERCFGVLKARWRCLRRDRVLHYAPLDASNIVTACVVLHNMAIHYRMPLVGDEDEDEEPQLPFDGVVDMPAGRQVRQNLILQYFNR